MNTVKSREPLDNPDAHTLANSVLDGKVDCSLNAFHDFKKKKFSKDEQTISRSEMQRALKQLGVQDVELKKNTNKIVGRCARCYDKLMILQPYKIQFSCKI